MSQKINCKSDIELEYDSDDDSREDISDEEMMLMIQRALAIKEEHNRKTNIFSLNYEGPKVDYSLMGLIEIKSPKVDVKDLCNVDNQIEEAYNNVLEVAKEIDLSSHKEDKYDILSESDSELSKEEPEVIIKPPSEIHQQVLVCGLNGGSKNKQSKYRIKKKQKGNFVSKLRSFVVNDMGIKEPVYKMTKFRQGIGCMCTVIIDQEIQVFKANTPSQTNDQAKDKVAEIAYNVLRGYYDKLEIKKEPEQLDLSKIRQEKEHTIRNILLENSEEQPIFSYAEYDSGWCCSMQVGTHKYQGDSQSMLGSLDECFNSYIRERENQTLNGCRRKVKEFSSVMNIADPSYNSYKFLVSGEIKWVTEIRLMNYWIVTDQMPSKDEAEEEAARLMLKVIDDNKMDVLSYLSNEPVEKIDDDWWKEYIDSYSDEEKDIGQFGFSEDEENIQESLKNLNFDRDKRDLSSSDDGYQDMQDNELNEFNVLDEYG
jgi:hypothetical protein